ncbi:MAG: MBL fold metallo-hydrolase [Thermosynechococcaceae cyanobacterium]
MPSTQKLYILDVGHGNSSVLITQSGVLVVDAGPGAALLEFLQREKVYHVDTLLISHADADHVRGVIALLASESVEIGQVYLNSDALKTSDLWDDLVYTLDKAHRDQSIKFETSLHRGHTDDFNLGCIRVEILAPSQYLAARGPGSTDREGNPLTSNSVSAVIRLSSNDQPVVMFPGDLDEVGLSNLLQENDSPSAPLVIFPHHGGHPGRNSDMVKFTRDFCNAVKPQKVIFSIGRGRYGTPQPEIVATILAEVPEVNIACTQLSVRCARELPRAEQSYLLEIYAHGQEHGHCCAGTLVIDLDDITTVSDPNIEHLEFIQNHLPGALCHSSLEGRS